MKSINNPEACIVCSRRSDGVAVGQPGRLGWYCFDCGPVIAWSVFYMETRNFDQVEQRACLRVAEVLGDGDLEVPAAEVPAFLAYVIKEFALAMRQDVESVGTRDVKP
jgi:hypothetical protein